MLRTQAIVVKGIDKYQVGQVAANIKRWRIPIVYSGKGIRYKENKSERKSVRRSNQGGGWSVQNIKTRRNKGERGIFASGLQFGTPERPRLAVFRSEAYLCPTY